MVYSSSRYIKNLGVKIVKISLRHYQQSRAIPRLPLGDISGADILFPAKSFPDSEGREDISESPNTLPGENISKQSENSG